MGLKHPISLKLKKHKLWNKILYKNNSSNLINSTRAEGTIIKLIKYYFQYYLISKPKIYYGSKGMKIKLYYYRNSLNKWTSKIYLKHSLYQLIKLEHFIYKLYNIPVRIKLIRISNPINNAEILGQLIGRNIKKWSLRKIWKILLRKLIRKLKIRKIKLNNKIRKNNIIIKKKLLNNISIKNWIKILYEGIFNKNLYSSIVGLKIKISGRMSKRRGASRAKTKSYSVGRLRFNSIKTLIDYSHIEKKDKNGSQSIKIYINHKIYKIIKKITPLKKVK